MTSRSTLQQKYPSAFTMLHGGKYRVFADVNSTAIGEGDTEQAAWDNAVVSEVRRVYPKAACRPHYAGDLLTEYVVWSNGNPVGSGGTIQSAWLDAFKNIEDGKE